MPPSIRKLIYEDKTDPSFSRTYANSVFVRTNATGEVVIDFCQETSMPNSVKSYEWDGEQWNAKTSYPDESEVNIERVFKHSFILPKETAKLLSEMLSQAAGDNNEEN